MNNHCASCGMLIEAPAYHPFIACALFKQTHDGRTVDANLRAVVEYGMRAAAAGVDLDTAMRRIDLVIAAPTLAEAIEAAMAAEGGTK